MIGIEPEPEQESEPLTLLVCKQIHKNNCKEKLKPADIFGMLEGARITKLDILSFLEKIFKAKFGICCCLNGKKL